MRKFFNLFCALALFITFLLSSTQLYAYDAYIDGIYYNLNSTDNTAEVTWLSINSSSNSSAYTGSVVIPQTVEYNNVTYSVTSIGDYAFNYCSSLTGVTIPNSVTSIGEFAFTGCSSLTDVTIPNSVTSIGEFAFEDCSSLTEVTIPNSVTSIGTCAFMGCSSLTDVTIPNSVTSIGTDTFCGCSSLTQVTIPNSVTSIKMCAFEGCSSLTEVTIPNSVTSIGGAAFKGCSSLTQVTIGESVTSIGTRVFESCTSLTAIYVDEDNEFYCSNDGVLYSKDMTELVEYPAGKKEKNFDIPEGVTSIGDYAFEYCDILTNVTISNSVTSIGGYAFYYCSSLTEVTIPNSVTSIGGYAFYYCSSLTQVTIGSSVASIAFETFGCCTSLKSVKIPESVTSIALNAFSNCSGLTTVTIGESVTSIGTNAFSSCSSLTQIYSANPTPPSISTSTFNGVDKDACTLTVPTGSKEAYASADYWSDFTNIVEEGESEEETDKVEIGGIYYNLNSTDNTAEVTYPTDGTYSGSVAIPSTVDCGNATYSVTSIGSEAFTDCTGLTSITIPNSVTSIGSLAFSGCTSLTTLILEDGTENLSISLDGNPVENCPIATLYLGRNNLSMDGGSVVTLLSILKNVSSLTTLTIGASFSSYSSYFHYFTSLKDIEVAEGNEAFCSIDSVVYTKDQTTLVAYPAAKEASSFVIPSTVTSIESMAFYGCGNLTEITLTNTTPPTCSSTSFSNFDQENCTLYVPAGSQEAYAAADYWSAFTNISEEGTGNVEYDQELLDRLTNLQDELNNFGSNLGQFSIDIYNATVGTEFGQYSEEDLASFEDVLSALVNSTANVQSQIKEVVYMVDEGSASSEEIYYEIQNIEASLNQLIDELDAVYSKFIASAVSTVTYADGRYFIELAGYDFDVDNAIYVSEDDTASPYSVKWGALDTTNERFVWDLTAVGDGTYEVKSAFTNSTFGEFTTSGSADATLVDGSEIKMMFDYDHTNDAGEYVVKMRTSTNSGAYMWAEDTNNGSGTKGSIMSSTSSDDASYFKLVSVGDEDGGIIYNVEIDNIYYNLNIKEGTAEVTSGSVSYSGSVVISSTVEFNNTTYTVTGIGEKAFYGCTDLTDVTIPETVTSIGSYAFYGCIRIIQITITNSVTIIKNYAFYGCTGLTEVVIGSSVTSIGEKAFGGCDGLKRVYLTNPTAPEISSDSFDGVDKESCELIVPEESKEAYGEVDALKDFTHMAEGEVGMIYNVEIDGIYFNINLTLGTAEVTSGSVSYSGSVVISSTIEYNNVTYTVTGIGEKAFQGCTDLTDVTIPETVTSIGSHAFDGCTGLTDVTIPESVTSIGSHAFYGCISIIQITITNSVTIIENYAFYGCTGLTEVIIGSSVTSIGEKAFGGCDGLRRVYLTNPTAPEISSDSFDGVDKESCELIVPEESKEAYGEVDALKDFTHMAEGEVGMIYNVEIGGIYFNINLTLGTAEVTSGSVSYSGSIVISSTIEYNNVTYTVTGIGEKAFQSCTDLTDVTIPETVTSIGSHAFDGCTSLTDVTIPESVTSIGSHAFYGCISIIQITISNSVTIIENYAFYGCTGLTEVIIGSSVTSIGEKAFGGCDGLRRVYLTNPTAPEISSDSFDGVDKESCELIVPEESKEAYGEVDALKDFTHIAEGEVGMIYNVEIGGIYFNINLTLGTAEVTSGSVSYSGSIVISSTIEYNNVTYTVTGIGEKAFQGCTDLTDVTIPETVTSIGSHAFDGCTGLTDVTIPESVSSIGSHAFYGCISIIQITISNSVTIIEDYAFYGCTGLTEVIIGSSVTSIGEKAFGGCDGLRRVYLTNPTPPEVSSDSFDGVDKESCELIVPEESKEAYGEVDALKDFTHMAEGEVGMIYNVEIDGIYFNINLTLGTAEVTSGSVEYSGSVVISSTIEYNNVTYTVTGIGEKAFQGCTDLTDVTIPETVTSIGSHAFDGCTGLTDVTIPESVTSIGSHAFYGCISIIQITISNSVTIIEDYAFYGCTGLTEVIIGSSVTSIGEKAFGGCDGLRRVYLTNPTPPEVSSDSFDGVDKESCELIVPEESKEAYGEVDALKDFTHMAEGEVGMIYNVEIGGIYFNINLTLGTAEVTSGGVEYSGSVVISSTVEYNNVTYTVTGIGEKAFKGCTDLTDVTIPETVTSIGSHAFDGCTRITEITISNSVTIIENHAFYGCTGLTEVIIGNSVTSIGEKAFGGCDGLRRVYLTNPTPPEISSDSFDGVDKESCELIVPEESKEAYGEVDALKDFTHMAEGEVGMIYNVEIGGIYFNINLTLGTAEVTSGSVEYSGSVVISSTVEYNNVTYTVTGIGEKAFQGCTDLTDVTIPETVTSIGSHAFDGCTGLTEITISNSVTIIENHAFYGCTGLTEVIIGSSVTSIGEKAFGGCDGLRRIYLTNPTPPEISSDSFDGVDKESCELIVPEESKEAYGEVDALKDFTHMAEGEVGMIYNIEIDGIYFNINLTLGTAEVTSGSVSYSGSIVISSTIEYNNVTYTVTGIGEKAFQGCTDLTDVTIPETVTSIGSHAFDGCTGITEITISNSVTIIENHAFYGCTGLTEVIIGSSVTSIGEKAFGGCDGLRRVYLTNPTPPEVSSDSFDGVDKESCELIVPEESKEAYGEVDALKDFTHMAEGEVGMIYNVEIDGIYFNINLTLGTAEVTSGSVSYSGSVVISSTVEYNNVTYTVTGIGEKAFQGCTDLTDVTIPETVTSIGSHAFDGCTSITEITISNSVTIIEDYAFYGCTGLTEVIIGSSVTSIGEKAFGGCDGLKRVYLTNPTAPEISSDSFDGVDKESCELIVPEESKEAYGEVDALKDFTHMAEGEVGMIYNVEIGGIYFNINLTLGTAEVTSGGVSYSGSIVISSTVEYNNVTYTVTGIGEKAFYGCTELTDVTIPESVTSIGNHAFDGCTSITEITISNSVTIIENHAFYGCTGLTEVIIGSSVTNIGEKAFGGCDGLRRVYLTNPTPPEISSDSFDGVDKESCELIVPEESKEAYGEVDALKDFTHMAEGEVGMIYNIEIGGIYFNINLTLGTAEVTSGSVSYSGSIVISSTVEYNNVTYTVTGIGEKAFQGCTDLTDVTIPETVTSIGSHAFDGCTSITEITISNSVTIIENYAFYGCTGLTEVIIGSSVTSIGEKAFGGCDGLRRVYITNPTPPEVSADSFDGVDKDACIFIVPLGSKEEYASAGSWQDFTNIVEGEVGFIYNVEIGGLYFNLDITSVTAEVTGISVEYSGSVVIPSIVEYGDTIYSVISIGDEAFSGCDGLTDVTIPESVTNIGSHVFSGCGNLKRIYLTNPTPPDIKPDAFDGIDKDACTLVVPEDSKDAYTTIDGLNDFSNIVGGEVGIIYNVEIEGIYYNLNITDETAEVTCGSSEYAGSVVIPSTVEYEDAAYSVTGIGDGAFRECGGLTEVTIPESVTEIGDYAFGSCTSLKEVTSLNPEPPVCGTGTFDDVDTGTCLLTVPTGSLKTYATADTWKDFLNQIEVGVRAASAAGQAQNTSCYTMDGKKVSAPQKGLNIVRSADGTVKKVLVK